MILDDIDFIIKMILDDIDFIIKVILDDIDTLLKQIACKSHCYKGRMSLVNF